MKKVPQKRVIRWRTKENRQSTRISRGSEWHEGAFCDRSLGSLDSALDRSPWIGFRTYERHRD